MNFLHDPVQGITSFFLGYYSSSSSFHLLPRDLLVFVPVHLAEVEPISSPLACAFVVRDLAILIFITAVELFTDLLNI